MLNQAEKTNVTELELVIGVDIDAEHEIIPLIDENGDVAFTNFNRESYPIFVNQLTGEKFIKFDNNEIRVIENYGNYFVALEN